MGFFEFWIKKVKFSFLLMFLIVVSGFSALYSIPKESSPDIQIGYVLINTPYIGVNPQDIDSLITEKIEKELKGMNEIKKINSTSSVGMSSIQIELKDDVDADKALNDIRTKVDRVSLPAEAEDPIVTDIDLSAANKRMYDVILYGKKEDFSYFSLVQKARELDKMVSGLGGVESIDISADEYEIKVLISQEKLEALGLSLAQVGNAISSQNRNVPIGNYEVGDYKYDFRIEGKYTSLEDLRETVISKNGSSLVKLSDVSEITLEYPDETQKLFGSYNKNGYYYISLGINKSSSANIFSVAKSSKEEIQSIVDKNASFSGLDIIFINDSADMIIRDYLNLASNAGSTIILIVVVMLLFVGLKEAFISFIIIPLSILITFIALNTLGFTLNFLTNFSLILVLGIAIDIVVVIVDAVAKNIKLGYNKETAILNAINDFKWPLLASTCTTLATFLPMIFLPGIMGKFLAYIPITVFSAVLASLFLSFTVALTLSYVFTRNGKYYVRNKTLEENLLPEEFEILQKDREGKIEDFKERKKSFGEKIGGLRGKLTGGLEKGYAFLFKPFISNKFIRIIAIIIPVFLLFLNFKYLSPKIGFVLMPSSDSGVTSFTIETDIGARKELLYPSMGEISEILSRYPEIKSFTIDANSNVLNINVELLPKDERELNLQRDVFVLTNDVLKDLEIFETKGFKVTGKAAENAPPAGSPVGITLIAHDISELDKLKNVSLDFENFLLSLPETRNITNSSENSPGQYVFKINYDKLNVANLNSSDIYNALQIYAFGYKAGTIKSTFEDNDIVLKVSSFDKEISPTDIENIQIPTASGVYRAGDFITYEFLPASSAISRENYEIAIKIGSDIVPNIPLLDAKGNLVGRDTTAADIQVKLDEFASTYQFPDGVHYSAGGEAVENQELIVGMVTSFALAVFIIFAILVLQFNSFSQPIINLYSIIMGVLGASLGLYLTGNSYSMSFGIGFIALTGMVVSNCIILVDSLNKNIESLEKLNSSPSREDYIKIVVESVKSRLNPVLVTSITTIFGLIPISMEDAFWGGLGYTVIFGLAVGSVMTLFVIPALYCELSMQKKLRRKKNLKKTEIKNNSNSQELENGKNTENSSENSNNLNGENGNIENDINSEENKKSSREEFEEIVLEDDIYNKISKLAENDKDIQKYFS